MAITTSSTTLPLHAGTWTIDPTHSTVEFTVRHLGLSKVRGRFNRFDAQLHVGSDLASTSLTADVDLSSVDTNNADRDGHLQGTDFFDAERHPSMTLESVSITEANGSYTVVGDLSINGATRPIELDVEFFGSEVFPMDQSTRAGFSATAALSRKAYGIEFNVPLGADKVMISDSVKIELEVQLVAPTD
jgi:polyisoprenoid-binding protein YceI